MKTEVKKLEEMSLYEMIQFVNGEGFDICDDDWDWGVYFGCEKSFDECADYYAKCMLIFALNITCIKYNSQWYSPCKVKDFLWENRKVFTKFFNEENREGYRPKDYKNIDPNVDSGFFEAFMEPMESLIVGNYCESDYEKLYKALIAQEETK